MYIHYYHYRNDKVKSTIEILQEDCNFQGGGCSSEKYHLLQLLDEKMRQLQELGRTLNQQRKTINEKDKIVKSIKLEMQQQYIKNCVEDGMEKTLNSKKECVNSSESVDMIEIVGKGNKDNHLGEEYSRKKTFADKVKEKAEVVDARTLVGQDNKDGSLNAVTENETLV